MIEIDSLKKSIENKVYPVTRRTYLIKKYSTKTNAVTVNDIVNATEKTMVNNSDFLTPRLLKLKIKRFGIRITNSATGNVNSINKYS